MNVNTGFLEFKHHLWVVHSKYLYCDNYRIPNLLFCLEAE